MGQSVRLLCGEVLWGTLEEQEDVSMTQPDPTWTAGAVDTLVTLRLGQQRILEMIAAGRPLTQILAEVCLLIEQQEAGLLCSVLLLDEQGRHTGGGVGPSLPDDFVRALNGIAIAPPYTGSCCRALDSGEEVVVPDIAADTRWACGWRELNLAHGLQACRSIPVFGPQGAVLASVAVFRRETGDPGPADKQLLGIATRLAGLAIQYQAQAEQGQRLMTTATVAQERTRLLLEAAAVLLMAHDPVAMLAQVFDKIAAHLKLDVFFNYMVTDSGKALRLTSWAGITDETARELADLAFGQALCGSVAQLRKPCTAAFVQESPDPAAQLIRQLGIRAYACHPLMADGDLLGTLSFASRRRDLFSADEVDFLATICRYVACAYERLRLIERLREADRRKDEFLATLAHELRNPLAPLSNAAQLLAAPELRAEQLRRIQRLIERQVGHMGRLLDDLLDVARITQGKLTLKMERVSLVSVIDAAVVAARPLIDHKRHALQISINGMEEDKLLLQADPVRLSQVLANLLTNAAKYTDAGGRIELAARRLGAELQLSVCDNGIGLPPQARSRIFEMFGQLDSGNSRAEGGLGIGLALVRGIIELHGGRVGVESAGLGQGSCFTVQLPLGSLSEALKPDAQVEAAHVGLKVLVADDNEDAAQTLVLLLSFAGYETRVATSGHAAVQEATHWRPDVAVLDIGMPDLDGYAVALALRRQDSGTPMLLIALTGWGQDDDRRRSAAAGFDHHLTKPVESTSSWH
jgi:signal transduction histidine kinase